jgi:L-alanine-DL-glutamate epimerase-like enolase superfamily enzyme
MTIQELRLTSPSIPFKVAFRHATADRSETSSVWVEALAADGKVGYGESCPRPYVTGETLDTAAEFFARHQASIRATVTDLASLEAWTAAHATDIDLNPAAWCALELALLDLLGREAGVPVEALLSVPPLKGPFRYTAILGDAGSGAFAAMAAQYAARGFRDFKIKLSGDPVHDAEKIAVLKRLEPAPERVRADANNVWPDVDEAVRALRALDWPFFGIEEPLAANQYQELRAIGEALDCRIVLDESFLRLEQMDRLRADPARWLINVRVSKMGGLLRSLAIVRGARAAGIGVIVGAQVGETSLLTRAGLTVAQAAGDLLVAQEGAFGTFLLERDVCDPPLMFGKAGVLDLAMHPSAALGPGFGLGTLSHV